MAGYVAAVPLPLRARRTTPAVARGATLLTSAAALVLATVLAGGSTVPVAVAVAAAGPTGSRGGEGIGDAYFPLDGNGGIDVRHYAVHDRYDLASGRLSGWTRVTLRATEDLRRFDLDLVLPASGVLVDGRRAEHRQPDGHELRITPDRPLRAGTVHEVVVRYAGRPGSIRWGGASPWLADEHEVIAAGQPHIAPWWFPANDHPRDRARMDLHLTVPRGRQVVANGRLVGSRHHGRLTTTHWRVSDPLAPYLAFFAAGSFQVERSRSQGVAWYSAVSHRLPASDRERSMRLMRRTPRVVAWLARELGPYPFDSGGGVTTSLPMGFALENQTRPTYPVLGADAQSILVHEVAHQWFGDSVAVHSWRDIWLNEGAASYVEKRWDETHGGPSAQAWLRDTYAEQSGNAAFWDLRIDDPGRDAMFAWPVYQRGAMTMQALRHRVGVDTFERLLRTWVSTRAGRTGSSEQFEQLAARLSGEDLTSFFDAWLRAPEAPERVAANGL